MFESEAPGGIEPMRGKDCGSRAPGGLDDEMLEVAEAAEGAREPKANSREPWGGLNGAKLVLLAESTAERSAP